MQTSLQCGGELIYGASADRAAQSGALRGGGGDSSPAPPADGKPDTGTDTHADRTTDRYRADTRSDR